MYGGSNGGPWARPSPGYGGPPPGVSGYGGNNSPGGSALHGGPYTGPPPPSAPSGQHSHYSPSPGPSSAHAGSPAPLHPPPPTGPASSSFQQPMYGNAHAPPGFVPAARPPPPGGYAGPPPSAQYGGPPTGPSSMMPPHGQYNGPPPGMGPGYGGPGQFNGPTAALPIGGVPAHTTIFVGTISGGVSDYWLKRLFDACGSLKSFKRVNASFGFAEFIDADSVLRALAVLPGMDLPSMGKERDNAAARKKLTVKADEKTRKYLDQYEHGRMQTQFDEQAQDSARRAVQSICVEMLDPNHIEEEAASTSTSSIPQHLKDLPPEELPEEHRGAVLSEIEKFRQASAARDEERKRKERVQEMDRLRASERDQRQPQQGRGDEAHGSTGPLQSNGRRSDPQSYSRPVSFVPGSTGRDETMLAPDEQDERDEQRRIQRERDEAMRSGQEAERQYQAQERTRLAHWDRELGIEEAELERRRRKAAGQRRLYEEWDQTRESERDMFHLDRTRWRAQRRQQREREEREDEADRVAQAEEEERARIETERFLAQQAEDMATFEREQRAAGVLMPGASGEHAPLRLKRIVAADGSDVTVPGQGTAQAPSQAQTTQAPAQQPKGILGTLDDDSDLSGIRRGKLGHIDLTDASDVNVMRERVRRDLPAQRDELFDKTPKWDQLNEASLNTRYREVIDKGLIASLGESVPDMVDEILAKVRAHASASDLIEVIEPVLEDEAAPLIATLWTEILVDTLAGLSTPQNESI